MGDGVPNDPYEYAGVADAIKLLESLGFTVFDHMDWGHFVTSGQSWTEYEHEMLERNDDQGESS